MRTTLMALTSILALACGGGDGAGGPDAGIDVCSDTEIGATLSGDISASVSGDPGDPEYSCAGGAPVAAGYFDLGWGGVASGEGYDLAFLLTVRGLGEGATGAATGDMSVNRPAGENNVPPAGLWSGPDGDCPLTITGSVLLLTSEVGRAYQITGSGACPTALTSDLTGADPLTVESFRFVGVTVFP